MYTLSLHNVICQLYLDEVRKIIYQLIGNTLPLIPFLYSIIIVFLKIIYLFSHWVLAVAHRIFLTVCGVFCSKAWALLFWCTGFSLVVVQGLEHAGSVVVACGLSCLWAYGNLVPQTGIQLMSPTLEDGFLTAGPPGKSHILSYFIAKQ